MDSSVGDTKFKQQVENRITAKTTETMIPFIFLLTHIQLCHGLCHQVPVKTKQQK